MTWMGEEEKHVADVIAASTAVGAFLTENLPTIALGLTVVWTGIRIYETNTVQRLLGRKGDGEETDSN